MVLCERARMSAHGLTVRHRLPVRGTQWWEAIFFSCAVVYLFASFEGIVETSSENPYSCHSGSCTARGRGECERQTGPMDWKITGCAAELGGGKKTADVLQGDVLADASRDTSSHEILRVSPRDDTVVIYPPSLGWLFSSGAHLYKYLNFTSKSNTKLYFRSTQRLIYIWGISYVYTCMY